MRRLALVAVFVGACGSDGAGTVDAAPADGRIPMPVDAGPDADLRDAAGPPLDDAGLLAFGPGVVLDTVHLAETGHSWAPYAPVVNLELDNVIADGTMLLLVEFRGLDDPAGQNDADGLDLGVFNGVDLDGNPNDNFTGSESLQVSIDSLDVNGNPRALIPDAALAAGALTGANAGPLLLYFPSLGELAVYDAQFSGTLVSGGGGTQVSTLMNGTISGVLLARDLGLMTNPVSSMCQGDTLLDVIAIGCLAIQGVQPDMDRDGDGLETFVEKTGMVDWVIDSCYDGNGTEYVTVPGTPCVLDPAFQDGYSVTIEVSGVRAILLPPP